MPLGPPVYFEDIGKTSATLDVRDFAKPGDRWVDARGHTWTVDHVSLTLTGYRWTLFCPVATATLREGERLTPRIEK